ncbi:MAG: WbqC family protein [Candidatus Aegiribacteria sp.]|nr:WbqC family protein [Candidatus Aegiribacteria sp.]
MDNLDKYKGSTIAIMQPYFFPYLGYFSLIKHTDYFIVFDEVQYIRKGWMNRNRILAPEKPNGGWQYISLPIQKAHREALISDIYINNNILWKDKLLHQLEHYRKKAPYFAEVTLFLSQTLNTNENSIAHLNAHLLDSVCEYLSIPFNYTISSEMDFPEMTVNHPGDWALNISKYLNVSTYINPSGGKEIFPKEDWNTHGINLRFLTSNLPSYSQRREESIMGLSIIDIMMFNNSEDISVMLDDITLS